MDLLINKFMDADTLKRLEIKAVSDSLVSWDIQQNADTVCGEICHVLRMTMIKNGKILKRKISYSPKYYVNPFHYMNYRSMRCDFMYEKTHSVPLKIEMSFEGRPVNILMVAQKITPSPINESIFDIELPYTRN